MLLGSFANAQDFDFSCGLTELQQDDQDYYGFYQAEFNQASDAEKRAFLESLAPEGHTITVTESYSNSHTQILNRFVVCSTAWTGCFETNKYHWASNSLGLYWKALIDNIKKTTGAPFYGAPTEEEAAADVITKAAKAIGDAYFLVNEIPSKHDFAATHINNLLALLNDRTCHNTRNNPKTNGDACLGSKYSGGPLTTANYFDNNYPDYTRHVEIWDGDVKIFNWLAGYDLEFNEVSNDRWNDLNIDLMKLIAELNGGETGNVDKDAAVKALLEDIDYDSGIYNVMPQLVALFFIDIEVSLLTQATIDLGTYENAGGLVGGSHGACYDNEIHIDLGTDYWNGSFFQDYQKAWLMYHELGHDVLNLDHVCGELEMMHPGLNQEGCGTAILSDNNWEAFHTGRARMISLEGQNIKTCD